jgi:N-acetylneuraminic acid mutarotase
MPVNTERGAAVVGAVGDVIYLAGGLRSGAVATVSSYSTTNDAWDDNLPALPLARDHGCGGVVGGKLYAIGGRGGSIGALDGRVFELSPGDSAWVEKTAMPTARGGIACGVFADRIIVAGGEGNPATVTRVFSEVEQYTPSVNRWDVLTPMVTPRHGMGAAVSAGIFFVPGGATKEGFGAVDTHERFRP